MIRFLGVCLVGLGAAAIAAASPPAVVYQQQAFALPHVAQLYAAQYVPPGAPPPEVATAVDRHTAAVDRHTAAVKELAAELQAARLARSVPPAGRTVTIEPARPLPGGDILLQQRAAPDAPAAAKASCFNCHAPAVSDDKGGGFALFNGAGDLRALGPDERRAVADRVSSESRPMPPRPRKLAAGDKTAIVEFFR